MKINFILPFTINTGGIRIALEYANRLQGLGHDVICYIPAIYYKFDLNGIYGIYKRARLTFGNVVKRGTKVDWMDNKVKIKLIPFICNMFIRDADAVIATAWPTAYSVYNLSKAKGEKFYFIQHYEIWSGPKELVDNSYMLEMHQIVIANWLKKIMNEQFNKTDVELIYNGIDLNEFYNTNKEYNKEKVIMMLYHPLEWKGYMDGLKAFEIAKKKHPELKLRLFGMNSGTNIPSYAEFYENPKRSKLRELYATSDIFVFPSKKEGWGLTPIEAMACKCAVVGTNTGALEDLGQNEVNALITEPEDIQSLSNNLVRLVENNDLLKKISEKGFETAKQLSWDKSVSKFENFLAKYKK